MFVFSDIRVEGSDLHLASIYHLVDNKGVLADPERGMTVEEWRATVDLAIYTARQRGFKSIRGYSFEETIDESITICPMTLMKVGTRGREYNFSRLLEHCNADAEPLDFWAVMMGLTPFDLWSGEIEKSKLSNTVCLDDDPTKALGRGEGAIVPTPQQLGRLIVELETRLAEAIKTALSSSVDATWTLWPKFGKSTACQSFPIADEGALLESPYLEDLTQGEIHAHDFCWLSLPSAETMAQLAAKEGRIKVDFFDESLPSYMAWVYEYFPHKESESQRPLQPKDFEETMPTFASFLCPALAVASFVFKSNQRGLRWRPDFEQGYWAMALYFCRLFCVASGKSFAKTLAGRPSGADLPPTDAEVQAMARRFAHDDRVSRNFPPCGGGSSNEDGDEEAMEGMSEDEKMEGVEEELGEEEHEEPPRAPSKRGVAIVESELNDLNRPSKRGLTQEERRCHQKELLAATKRYEEAVNELNRGLARAFDEGRGALLMKLLYGWPVVLHVVGEDEGERLSVLRKQKLEAQTVLDEWVYEVVEPHVADRYGT